MKDNVVVTGIGVLTPLTTDSNVDMFWNALISGKDAIRRTGLPIIDIDMEWLVASIELLETQLGARPEEKLKIIAEKALSMAVRDAKIFEEQNIGLSLGTVLGNILCKETRMLACMKQGRKFLYQNEALVNEKINSREDSLSFTTKYLADQYKLKGPNITVSTACSSGTDAIGIAARKIAAGKSDIMISGGVDVLSDFSLLGFHVLQALTEDKVRPFDKNRSGLALGEGAAFLVLESETHAVSRGAEIYGRVMGYASRSDANHLTGPHPEGRGLSAAISEAISQAHIRLSEVDYINAHGTGTVYNDLMETKALKKVFGMDAYRIPISSTKSMLGHSFGAAGAIEAICCLLSIKNNMIHPTINFRERDPACDLDYVPNQARTKDVSVAMSLSAGFGGQNSAIIFGGI